MKTSDAQLKAVQRYKAKNRERIHKVTFEIYDTKDPELWPWLNSREESKGAVMRRLMHEEIKRTGWTLDEGR